MINANQCLKKLVGAWPKADDLRANMETLIQRITQASVVFTEIGLAIAVTNLRDKASQKPPNKLKSVINKQLSDVESESNGMKKDMIQPVLFSHAQKLV